MSTDQGDEADEVTADQYARLPEVLLPEEAAMVLRISAYQVRKLAGQGRIPGTQISNRWRFSKSQLEALVRGELSEHPPLRGGDDVEESPPDA